jgi:two-component system, NarL family, invasion response regulator UvrY
MTTALIIDDHPVVLQGCKRFLEEAGVQEVWTSSSFAKGFGLYRKHQPDLIFLDLAVQSGVLGGLSFVQRFRVHDRQTPIIVFSMHSDPVIVSRAINLGANGYLLKDTWHEEFMEAFQQVRAGGSHISHELASELAFLGIRGSSNPLHALSMRELQVLALIAEGNTYKVISDRLAVSIKTVANTASQIKVKLRATSLTELTHIANRHLPMMGLDPKSRGTVHVAAGLEQDHLSKH